MLHKRKIHREHKVLFNHLIKVLKIQITVAGQCNYFLCPVQDGGRVTISPNISTESDNFNITCYPDII